MTDHAARCPECGLTMRHIPRHNGGYCPRCLMRHGRPVAMEVAMEELMIRFLGSQRDGPLGSGWRSAQ